MNLYPIASYARALKRALAALMRTARIYKTATRLVDPRSGREFPVLLPRVAPASTAGAGLGEPLGAATA